MAEESIKDFVKFHNENYPENYIPNSRIGAYNLHKQKEHDTKTKELLQRQKQICFGHWMMRMHDKKEKISAEEMEQIFLSAPNAEHGTY